MDNKEDKESKMYLLFNKQTGLPRRFTKSGYLMTYENQSPDLIMWGKDSNIWEVRDLKKCSEELQKEVKKQFDKEL